MDDIVKQLENKLNAGDYESAQVLLKQGLATDALDQRLLDMAERIRVGMEQQEKTLAADKLAGEKLASAREALGAGQYETASTLIAEARQLGAAALGKSRTALEGKDFDVAEQAAKKAMLLKPQAAEAKQLLVDIQDSRVAASRDEKLALLQDIINHALDEGDINKAQETFALLNNEDPEESIISHFGTLISSKEKTGNTGFI